MPVFSSGGLPDGVVWGRECNNKLIGNAGYYFSDTIRNFSIQQLDDIFTFRRWLSSQNNFNVYPYAVNTSENGSLFTYISNPTFVLDAGEWLDTAGDFFYTWIYLKSTLTSTTSTPNHETLYYKSNATGLGVVNKVLGSPNYEFVKAGIENILRVGDYVYISFVQDNTDLVALSGIISTYDDWFGAFFRVTQLNVGSVVLVEDNSIRPILFPSSIDNNFIKGYPIGGANLVANYAMLYDLGYCFRRPADTTNYYRPIAMTINEAVFGSSYELNGIIQSLNNFEINLNQCLKLGFTQYVLSPNFPICRQIQYYIRIYLTGPDNPILEFSPLGSMDVTAAPVSTFLATTILSPFVPDATISTLTHYTRGIPVVSVNFTLGDTGETLESFEMVPISVDYLCRL